MKIVRAFQKLIPVAGLICLAACGNHSGNSNSQTAGTGPVTKAATQTLAGRTAGATTQNTYIKPSKTENIFNQMRTMAFTITPTQLKITVPADREVVYGVIFDQHTDQGTATLVSYQTGQASLYQNNGTSMTGGSSDANVSSAAKGFVALAQTFLDHCIKARTTAVPDKGVVKFYLLTNRGIYEADETLLKIKEHTSLYNALYDSGAKVLSELKKAAKNKDYVVNPAS